MGTRLLRGRGFLNVLGALVLTMAALAFAALVPQSALADGVTVGIERGENSWASGAKTCRQYALTISNATGSGITDWCITVDVDDDTEIESSWNCTAAIADGKLTLSSGADYTKTIAAGDSVQGIGLIVKSTADTPWSTYNATYKAVDAGQTGNGSGDVPGGNADSVSGGTSGGSAGSGSDRSASGSTDSGTGGDSSGSASGGTGSGSGSSTDLTVPVANNLSPLHVEGTRLCDASGNAVRLQGVSLHGLGFGTDFTKYVNKAAFQTLRDDWGANVVRLPVYSMDYGGWCNGGDRNALRTTVNNGVTYTTELGMYAIVDWHILSDGNPQTHQSEAVAFFREMSARYDRLSNVIYEICNEPNGGTSWEQIKKYADEVIPVIRANDPDALIFVGTPTWSQDVDQVIDSRIDDSNVMYALHFYAATHKDDLRAKAERALKAGVPIFITESSIFEASGNGTVDKTSAEAWKTLFKRYGLSYIEWSLCNKAESASAIRSSCGKTSGWSVSDLSATGQWYRATMRELRGTTGSGSTGGSTSGTTSGKAAQVDTSAVYELYCACSGKVLRAAGGGTRNGTNV